MALRVLLIAGLLATLWPGVGLAQEETDLVNLDHLIYLTEPVTIDGREMALVHIYAEYPDYEWVDAAGEGLSCVDDVARAAIVYLWQYERTGDPALLELARATLEFVRYMQAEDGAFYNFVYDRQGTINRQGSTSYRSLGWWAMRGLWALGEGVRVFDRVDPAYADVLAEAYRRTEAALAATVGDASATINIHGFELPAWLPGGEADVSAIGLLGLTAYYRARPNPETAAIITALADGIAALRLGDHATYPFGMHPVRVNAPGFWHDWGAHMTHALVEAGMALNRQDWIDSAAAEADSFLLRHLTLERFRNIGVVPDRLGQIAYGTNMLVQAYMALYRATGEPRYARYAGLAGSWYFGNNMAGVPMVDLATGRVFDGINGPVAWRVNRNSGAESTIEGLLSLIVLADEPLAVEMLGARSAGGTPSYRLLEAEDGQRVLGTPVYYAATWTGEGYVSAGRYVGLGEGQRMRLQFEIDQAGDYLLYAAHLHQAASSTAFTIRQTDSPPVIDGDLADWPDDVPTLESNTQRQFLRGAGLWQGPEVDSHAVRLLWDADRLYIAATVRDPVHDQPYTLSTAWQGDTLWFYVTATPDARTLSAKFTLAQTPDGPQVWDWIHTRFLRGAELAFTPLEGGYIYEASVPWESLGVTPQAGGRIGFEAGRGIGGNSFMDLTGRDPDVPANLLALVLATPDLAADSLVAPEVALRVRLDDGDPVLLPQTISPDSDYFWLDLVTAEPVRLEAGTHTLRYEYAGEGGSAQNPGLAKVDAFYLQPAILRRVFALPDGRQFELTYNTLTGQSTLVELAP